MREARFACGAGGHALETDGAMGAHSEAEGLVARKVGLATDRLSRVRQSKLGTDETICVCCKQTGPRNCRGSMSCLALGEASWRENDLATLGSGTAETALNGYKCARAKNCKSPMKRRDLEGAD